MKKKPLGMRLISCILSALLMAGAVSVLCMPSAAATVKEQVAALEKEQQALQKQIAGAKNDLANSKKTRDLYNNQINNVKKQISLLDGQIDSLNTQISGKNSTLADLEKQVAANAVEEDKVREMLGQRLNALAKRGNFSTLQMLMDTENYADYLIKAKLMEKIAENDQQAIAELEQKLADIRNTQTQVETEKTAIEEKKKEIETLRATSNTKKRQLDSLYTAANKAYKQDQAEVNALNKELEETENNIKRLLASVNSDGKYTATSMYWPVPTVRALSSYFGTRWGKLHKGVDIANGKILIYGQNIVAAADGTVIYANSTNSWGGGYGYYCMIDHGKNSKGQQIVTLYAHCSAMYARVGQRVTGGKTVIAKAGSSGNVTGPHLHFEVRVNGTPVDPLKGYIAVNGK